MLLYLLVNIQYGKYFRSGKRVKARAELLFPPFDIFRSFTNSNMAPKAKKPSAAAPAKQEKKQAAAPAKAEKKPAPVKSNSGVVKAKDKALKAKKNVLRGELT